ncbi:MAG TPA: ester cyclase [Pyrinomonadaceae bacterium]|nr:ester cyclase [Pyrinomonadaceae bacterium]
MADTKAREKNKAIARRLLKAWNQKGQAHLPSELVSTKVVTFGPNGTQTGRAAAETLLPARAFTKQRFVEQILIADDERVFIAWEVTGTHSGALYGVAATGQAVRAHGADVLRIVGGKVVEHINYYSTPRLHLLARLGLLSGGRRSLLGTRAAKERLVTEGLLGRNRVLGRVDPRRASKAYQGLMGRY